jgi:SP family sugar:H+ symporter-like MFS transporter
VPVGSALFLPNAIGAGLSPKQLRGRLGSLHQPTITLGIFAALLSDTIFAGTAGTASKTFWLGLEASRWTFFCSLPAQSARSLTLLEQFVDDRRTCVAHSE